MQEYRDKYTKEGREARCPPGMQVVRLNVFSDLLDELKDGNEEVSLTRLVNSAIRVGLKHKDEIIKDAKGVNNTWNTTR
jgi:hypothetical protein